jgi:hypothetical protein
MLIQIVLVGVLALALFMTWRRAWQSVISRLEALVWSVLWIGAAVIVLLPQTTTTVAHIFGVGRGVDFILYTSVVILFVLVFKIFVTLERIERTFTELIRREALKDIPVCHPERSPTEPRDRFEGIPPFVADSSVGMTEKE